MTKMKIELLYILDCPWCVKTKELIRESLRELKAEARVEEILIDTAKRARQYRFLGSPTIRINGKDIEQEIIKGQCLPCEELAEHTKAATTFIKQECTCGCRLYFYRGRQYPYPPKGLIKAAIRKLIG